MKNMIAVKHVLSILLSVLTIFSCCGGSARAEQEKLRGYQKGEGYVYVQYGTYPQTTADGTDNTPVLWKILSVDNGIALLLSNYCIDGHQAIEADAVTTHNMNYGLSLNSYKDTDLYTWMQSEMSSRLFRDTGTDAVHITERGTIFILTDVEMQDNSYGFRSGYCGARKERVAAPTYYTRRKGCCSGYPGTVYWVDRIRDTSEKGHQMQVCGANGHMSWGGYGRTNVAVRPAFYLDTAKVYISGGTGTQKDPYVLQNQA